MFDLTGLINDEFVDVTNFFLAIGVDTDSGRAHWPSLCIAAVVARTVVSVVVVCAETTPVINAVPNDAPEKYFAIIVSFRAVNPLSARSLFLFHPRKAGTPIDLMR